MFGLAIGVIVGLTAFGALTGYKKSSDAGGTPPPPDSSRSRRAVPNVNTLLGVILAMARKQSVTAAARANAVAIAVALGLPLTANAVQNESALPTTEKWPGTSMSVRDYVQRALTMTPVQSNAVVPGSAALAPSPPPAGGGYVPAL